MKPIKTEIMGIPVVLPMTMKTTSPATMERTLISMNPKFDRVTWLAEILAILDESQGIRERIEDMTQRLGRNNIHVGSITGVATNRLRALEIVLDDIVDNDLAATAKELSKKTKIMLDNSPEDY